MKASELEWSNQLTKKFQLAKKNFCQEIYFDMTYMEIRAQLPRVLSSNNYNYRKITKLQITLSNYIIVIELVIGI